MLRRVGEVCGGGEVCVGREMCVGEGGVQGRDVCERGRCVGEGEKVSNFNLLFKQSKSK